MVYKNTNAVNKQQFFLPVVTRLPRRHAEVKDRMPQPHDAAASAQCHGGTLMSATLKSQPPPQNPSFDFCVPHQAYASVTAWLLKTNALHERHAQCTLNSTAAPYFMNTRSAADARHAMDRQRF